MIEDKYHLERPELNRFRFTKNSNGHYESYFLRANHPTKPLAFWFRYTIFSPKNGSIGNGENDIGELWAVFFDKENDKKIAVKAEYDIKTCSFSPAGLDVKIADAGTLTPGNTKGAIVNDENSVSWDLTYSSNHAPLKLLPSNLYNSKFPKAKALVANPLAVFKGMVEVNEQVYQIDHWVGSENHNWGSQHTDEYAWGQVAGFDNEPNTFLECATTRVKIGPFKTPWMTTLVFRFEGKEIAINSIWKAIKANAFYDYSKWQFDTQNEEIRIKGVISAPKEDFAQLEYYNPPGGSSTCLNTKIAHCTLTVIEKGKPDRIFKTANRAAFEILTPTNNLQ
jgi:hypothetical protein